MAKTQGGHHLILGETTDFLTGKTVPDTHDERFRQKIARILVTEKGFPAADIERRRELVVHAGERCARIYIDFIVRIDGRAAMVVKYGPGSVVTRQRPALAASRVLADHQIPVAVATNGETAHVIDGPTGKVVGEDFAAVPGREELAARMAASPPQPVPPEKVDMARRILFAFEVDGACPCDDDVCLL